MQNCCTIEDLLKNMRYKDTAMLSTCTLDNNIIYFRVRNFIYNMV